MQCNRCNAMDVMQYMQYNTMDATQCNEIQCNAIQCTSMKCKTPIYILNFTFPLIAMPCNAMDVMQWLQCNEMTAMQ